MVKRAAQMAEEWNKSTLQWSNYFKSTIVALTPYIGALVDGTIDWVTRFKNETLPIWDQWYAKIAAGPAAAQARMAGVVAEAGALAERLSGGTVGAERIAESFAAVKSDVAGVAGMAQSFSTTSARAGASWDKIAADAKGAAAEAAKAATSIDRGPTTKYPDKDPDKDKIAGQARQYDAQITDAQANLERMKSIFNLEAEAYKISQSSKALYTEAAIEQVYEQEKELLKKKQALYDEGGRLWGDVERQRARITEQYEKQMLQTVTAAQKQMQQEVTKDLNVFVSAFNSQFQGLLSHTESWGQAMQKIGQQLFMALIQRAEQWAVEHIAVMVSDSLVSKTQAATDVTTHAADEAAKTQATLAGVATRQAAEAAGITSSLPARMANFTSTIMADAAATFAGVFANLAPVLGPAAAGPAAASQAIVMAQLANVPKLDVGGYVLSSGLAMIHSGESIVPAAVNQPYGGGGGGGSTINVNGPVIGTQAFVNSLVRQLAPALATYARNNPSTQ